MKTHKLRKFYPAAMGTLSLKDKKINVFIKILAKISLIFWSPELFLVWAPDFQKIKKFFYIQI
jgi:hypothetical protein